MAQKRMTGRAAATRPPAGNGAGGATQRLRTADSFTNFIARVGQGTGNQHDGAHYGFNPVTRNRLQMEWVYRGSWVAGRVVDAVARDMTREGIDINTSADSGDVKQFDKGLARMKVWKQLCENIKWARLYGGSCAFMMIDGQNPATPLKPERIGKGQFRGLLPMDRWLLNPSLQELVSDFGPHFGKPVFYQTVPDSMGMPLMTIHHSRMVRMDGVELPYWQKIAENLWGQSVLERMWDRLLAYDSTTTGVAQLVYKAHLRTLKMPNLRDYIGQGGAVMNGVLGQVNMIRAMQTNEGLTLIDKEDEFDVQTYNFAGLDDVLVQFGEQLCGAVEIPAVRLFGQSPAGFNSGDSDLRSYYDSIKQNQEADLGPQVETLYRVAWLSEFGSEPPEKSFDLEFEHLWQMDEEQKAGVTKTTEEAIGDAYERQIIDRATAMRELKNLGREVGTFSLIEEEAITEAEDDPPPTPEALGLVAPPKPEPGAAGAKGGGEDDDAPPAYKPDDAKPFKALDAEGVPQHPETGRFTHGMGLGSKRYNERGEKDDDGEWADSPLDPVRTKSMREAIQAAHPHTCKAYGELTEIEPWKLQGPQTRVNIKKVGEYRRDHGEPITVVKRAGEHGIVDGHHRAVAAHLQGRSVEANVVDMDRAFAEAGDHEAANEGLGILGGLHLATQLRLKNTPTPKRTKDSVLRRLLRLLSLDAEWDESKHPRAPDGKFGTKGSGWTKVGEKLGSNEGGTYLSEASNAKYYVKFPKDPEQAKTEVLSANLASLMHIQTTSPYYAEIDGKIAVVSVQQKLAKIDWAHPDATITSMSATQRLQLARIYYHAKLTKNWDVLGADQSNIMMDSNFDLVQMDTGGCFEFRAQGKHKDYGTDTADTDLMNKTSPSGKVFNSLMTAEPKVFTQARDELSQLKAWGAIFDTSGLENSQKLKENFAKRVANMPKVVATQPPGAQVVAPTIVKLQPLDPAVMAKMKSGTRIRHQMKVAHQSDGHTASNLITQVIKCPPPPINDKNKQAVDDYVASSGGINHSLRNAQGDVEKVGSYYKAQVHTLDEMMRNARDYAIQIDVTRGIPTHVIAKMNVGDTFIDHAYSSTSFSREKAQNFGPQAHLEIRLPKGFKFLSVPSFAKAGGMKTQLSLAMGEAEAILPRGCGYKVREIKKEGHRNVYYVDAVFSSIQPPREKWISSLTEKREAKKGLIFSTSPSTGAAP